MLSPGFICCAAALICGVESYRTAITSERSRKIEGVSKDDIADAINSAFQKQSEGEQQQAMWSGLKNVGKGAIQGIADSIEDPTGQKIGQALVGIVGSIAALPCPPASLAIGAILGLSGGVVKLFSNSTASHEFTNNEIMDTLKSGLA